MLNFLLAILMLFGPQIARLFRGIFDLAWGLLRSRAGQASLAFNLGLLALPFFMD